ncbi:efflux RND transporter permease subunit [Proteiniborus sp. MB09-C3]|uniref:efflux RND transporter permease subunit n=1 Tax=Proteiniborus sp. MB09-C3 TaxID=3050072 RepID=UPI002552DA24|nr:efflux RND transporter permease subunit [Proteiniborus sp. MB09-C3]WIV13423.1 efflux RND transporter permease subunit [Proteiniborus sp. MB09-C3]
MTHFAVNNRRITLFLALILTIAGLYSYYVVPKQDNPDVAPSIALVTAVYPGAAPEDVHKLVTKKLEDSVEQIEGFDKVVSYSKNSLSILVVYLINDADVNKSWAELINKMTEVKPELPEEVTDIKVNTQLADTSGIIISFSGDKYSYEQLAAYAENIKNELTKINGISRFEVDGKLEKEIVITIDVAKINQLDISLDEVVQLLKIQNMEIPSGSIKTESSKINVKIPVSFNSIEDIKNTIVGISKDTGAEVRIKDIGQVSLKQEEGTLKYKKNGKNAVLLTGYFNEDKNIVLVGKEVRNTLNKLKESLPEGVIFDEVLFQPEDVSNAVSSFMSNLIQGIVFVLIVVLIGMGLRNALVVSTAIPFSIVLTLVAMYLLKIKVHQISTAALIIALGMLVDNAIVVSDAIQYLIDEGYDKLYAVVEGARKSMIPIFTSTLTTVAAFVPLLLLPGMVGEFVYSLPMVVIIALSASFLVAMIITPTLAYIFFKPSKKKAFFLERLYPIFNKMLLWGLKRRKTIIAISFVALLLTIFLTYQIGLQFFPYIDKNVIYIDIQSEIVGNIEETEKLTEDIEKILVQHEEIIDYTTSIGGGLPKFYLTVTPTIPSTDHGQILLKLDLKKGGRLKSNEKFANYLQETLEKSIVGGTAAVKLLEYAEPIGAPVRIRVSGESLDRVMEVAEELQSEIRDISGTINIRDDAPKKSYEYIVDIDPDIAMHHGITKVDVQRQVNIALMGAKATTFRKAGNEYSVVVKSDIDAKSQLENLAIKSSITGSKILLKQIAEIKLGAQTDTITSYNKDVAVTVYSDVKDGYSPVDIQNTIEKSKLENINTQDVTITFDGEREQIIDKFSNVGFSAIFAILAIYIILLFQFRSFSKPMIILITLPLSLIGSIVGLSLFRQPLSFMAFLGIVSLFGVVVNNAILLIEYINEARDKGHDAKSACVDAVEKRFRPIILTTTTTVIGLVPLVLSGSPMFTPMAVSLMSGLMVSTILTLVIIPVVYSLMAGFTEKHYNKRQNRVKL